MDNTYDVPNLVRQIESRHNQLRGVTKSRQIKQVEKELPFLYDDLCAAYLIAAPEQRVDLSVALEYRDQLLTHFVDYFNNIASQAIKNAPRKRQRSATHDLIQHGVAANVIIGRKVTERELEAANDQIISAAEMTEFDILELARDLEVPYKYYLQRAIQYNKGHDRIRALKSLGIALKLNPKLEHNDRVIALAVTLTGETAHSALITLSEGYVLKKVIGQLEAEQRSRLAAENPKPRSALGTIRAWFSSETQQ